MRRVTPVLLAVLALTVASCGSGDDGEATTTSTLPFSTTTTAPAPTTTDAPATTTTAETETTTTTTALVTTTTLAGKPIDFGPTEGDVLMVAGVRHDDVLNLRSAPGANQPIKAEIPPTFDELVAEGSTRELPSSFWIQVDYDGTVGWVHMSYIGYWGDTTDDTSRIIRDLGETPVEESMTNLGDLIADQYAAAEGPESDIVQVTPVVKGDLAEVTYDVIGLGDDAVRGVRIHVFAEEGPNGFSLKSVEATTICGRGVDDGTCL